MLFRSSMLDREFLYNFSASQKKLIKRETGCMIGSGAFLKITTDDWTRWPYLLLFSGSPALSAIISDGSRYRTAADQLHDLEMAQEYAKRSRKLCLLRLGKLFYNVDIIDDGFFHYGDYPCHTIDTANQKIYLTSKPSMERKNLFLGGRFGDIIFSPRPGREDDITTPVLTGFEDGTEKEGREEDHPKCYQKLPRSCAAQYLQLLPPINKSIPLGLWPGGLRCTQIQMGIV